MRPKTKKELSVLTRKIEYPEYLSLEKADSLARKLIEESGINKVRMGKLDDKTKDKLFLIPGYQIEGRQIDNYLYSALSVLGATIWLTKDLYKRNGIKFPQSKFLSEVRLDDIIPNKLAMKLKSCEVGHVELGDLTLGVAERFLEAIETQFYHLHDYDSRKTNPRLEQDVERRVQKIARYATLGLETPAILKGFNRVPEAGSLEKVLKELKDTRKVSETVRREDQNQYLQNLLKVHAQLNGLNCNSHYPFAESMGEDISIAMDIANTFYTAFHGAADQAIANKDRLLVPQKNFIYSMQGGKEFRELWQDNWVGSITETMRRNVRLEEMLANAKSPFLYLDEKLHALGVPYQLSKAIAEGLSFGMIGRTDPEPDKKIRKGSNIYDQLDKEDSQFIEAVRELVRKTTGKEPNKVSYKFFEKENMTDVADAISPIVYVTKLTDEGIKIIAEKVSKQGAETTLETVKQQYGPQDGDIFVRKNMGVCFILQSDLFGSPYNPKFSIVEAREAHKEVAEFDKLGAKLLELEVDVHETVHAAQVGSKLVWREVASYISKYICDQVIKEAKLGRLHYEFAGSDLGIGELGKKGKTLKQLFSDILEFYVKGSLGKGKLAETMREEGFMQGEWSRGISPLNSEDRSELNLEEIRKIKMEESQSAAYTRKVGNALRKLDMPRLEQLEREGEEKVHEMSAIIETMAEAYALTGMKDYINHLPERKCSKEQKQKYYNSLVSKIVRRGELAQKYVDIVRASKNTQERDARLAEVGMRYEHAIVEHNDTPKNLLKLGYNPVDPQEAYENMQELHKRAEKKGMKKEEVLEIMNSSKALLGIRYSRQVPLFLKIIEQYGPHKAFTKMLEAETMTEIEGMLKDKN